VLSVEIYYIQDFINCNPKIQRYGTAFNWQDLEPVKSVQGTADCRRKIHQKNVLLSVGKIWENVF